MAQSALKFIDKTKLPQLKNVAIKSADKALYNLARFIAMSGKQSIRQKKKPSKPGTPFGRASGALKKALWVERDNAKGTAVIGYFHGHKVADLQELGGRNKLGRKYPRRSALEPALEKGIKDFKKKFADDFERYFKM